MIDNRIFNFSAGPATLPEEVLQKAQKELLNYNNSGMSVMEMSHRSKWFQDILNQTKKNIATLYKFDESYEILFLQGGASLQFAMLPMNFLNKDKKAGYLNSGSWAKKAIQQAHHFGTVETLWDGKEDSYRSLPDFANFEIPSDLTYCHMTSNETIEGVQNKLHLESDIPIVCDASSDIFSRPLPINNYDLIYAGAQKNAGPAGVTLVIGKKDFFEKAQDGLPAMLSYKQHIKSDSSYNTPPTFAIYIVGLVTQWLLDKGGLAEIEQLNQQKADKLYKVIDSHQDFYQGHAQKEFRSTMNVTWRISNSELEPVFIEEAKSAGLTQLKGHRSVGGLRASIYNAMPIEGIEKLASFMRSFAESHK